MIVRVAKKSLEAWQINISINLIQITANENITQSFNLLQNK